MGHATTQPVWVQGPYKWRTTINVDIDASTGLQTEDASQDFDVTSGNVQARLNIAWGESAGQTANKALLARLQYQINGGTWTNVTTTTTNAVFGFNDTANSDASTGSTAHLTAPTGCASFVFSTFQEDGVDSNSRKPSDQWYREEYTVEFNSSQLADNDSINFRLIDDAATETFTTRDSTPNATITKGGGAAEADVAIMFGANQ